MYLNRVLVLLLTDMCTVIICAYTNYVLVTTVHCYATAYTVHFPYIVPYVVLSFWSSRPLYKEVPEPLQTRHLTYLLVYFYSLVYFLFAILLVRALTLTSGYEHSQ